MSTAVTQADPAIGFQSLTDEISLDRLPIEGELPRWLSGSLLRTGPAQFEIGEQSMRHWFDGLAMLHRFSFADGDVSYANRFLESEAYKRSRAEGRIAMTEFGTDPCRSLYKRVSSVFTQVTGDNANVNVSRIGDEYVALTETPMPVEFDPVTLETLGVDRASAAPGEVSTAHPHLDASTGALINYAAKLGPRSSYRIYSADGRDSSKVLAERSVKEPAYMHSFGMTEDYIVLAECPFVVNPIKLATMGLRGRAFIENFEWKPEQGSRFIVFDRASGDVVKEFAARPFFCFHHVNAFQRGDQLVVDLVAFEDPSIIKSLYLESVRSDLAELAHSDIRRFTLGLADGSIEERVLFEGPFELPRINYRRCNERPYRYTYGIGNSDTDGYRIWDQIVKVDVDAGTATYWHEPGMYPGEPVFVAEPGASDEDAGALLSVVLDGVEGRSSLLVLDAKSLEVVARARVPHHIPFSFHGQYFS